MSRKHSGVVRCRECHDRLVYKEGLCVLHQPRQLGLLYTIMAPPDYCPHCHAGPPGWRGDAVAYSCFYCGEDWVRRIEVVGTV